MFRMASITLCVASASSPGIAGSRPLLDRVEKVADHRTMRLMREAHHAGAAAGTSGILQHFLAAIDEGETQAAALEPRGALRADDVHPFAAAGLRGDRGDDRARRAIAETHQRGCIVLGLHPVQRGGAHLRRLDALDADAASGTDRANGSPGSSARRRHRAPSPHGQAHRNRTVGATRAPSSSPPGSRRAPPSRST